MCISPLVLAASKSHAGHSEAAAGAVALLRVDEEFASRRIAMLNYLRILSPYLVTGSLGTPNKMLKFSSLATPPAVDVSMLLVSRVLE